MHKRVMDWYHLYIKNPCRSRLKNPGGMLHEGPCHNRCVFMIIHARYINISKREIIFMDV